MYCIDCTDALFYISRNVVSMEGRHCTQRFSVVKWQKDLVSPEVSHRQVKPSRGKETPWCVLDEDIMLPTVLSLHFLVVCAFAGPIVGARIRALYVYGTSSCRSGTPLVDPKGNLASNIRCCSGALFFSAA